MCHRVCLFAMVTNELVWCMLCCVLCCVSSGERCALSSCTPTVSTLSIILHINCLNCLDHLAQLCIERTGNTTTTISTISIIFHVNCVSKQQVLAHQLSQLFLPFCTSTAATVYIILHNNCVSKEHVLAHPVLITGRTTHGVVGNNQVQNTMWPVPEQRRAGRAQD